MDTICTVYSTIRLIAKIEFYLDLFGPLKSGTDSAQECVVKTLSLQSVCNLHFK